MNDKKKNVPGNDDYREEMDELARIFKEELGKAIEDAEEASQIDDIDDIEVEGYDPKALSLGEKKTPLSEDELCECCGEHPKGTKKHPDGPFCEECEAVMEKYPYDWKSVVGFIITLCVAAAALFCFVSATPIFATMKQADKAVHENRLFTARVKYDKAVSLLPKGKENTYLNLYAKRIRLDYNLMDLTSVFTETDKIFNEKTLKLAMFKDIDEKYDELWNMKITAEAIQNLLVDKYGLTDEGILNIQKEKYDDIIASLDNLSGKKIYEKNGEIHDELDTEFTPDGSETVYTYHDGWLDLYKYTVAVYCERDKTDFIKFLEDARGTSEYLNAFVSPLLASTYIGVGQYEKAEPMISEVRAHNIEDSDYYMLRSMMFRYRDKDYQKGVDICLEGLNMLATLPGAYDLVASYGNTLSMQKTLCYMMLSESSPDLNSKTKYNKLAYESANECMSYQQDAYGTPSVPTRDLKAILALATGDTETFKKLEDEIKQYSGQSIDFTQDVTDYREGKITLTDIAGSGRFDII